MESNNKVKALSDELKTVKKELIDKKQELDDNKTEINNIIQVLNNSKNRSSNIERFQHPRVSFTIIFVI